MAEEKGFWDLRGQVANDVVLRVFLRINFDGADPKASGDLRNDPIKERDKFNSFCKFWISDLFILSVLLGWHLSNARQELPQHQAFLLMKLFLLGTIIFITDLIQKNNHLSQKTDRLFLFESRERV